MTPTKYTHADLNPMSWSEFGVTMEKLRQEVKASGLHFDAIAPVLRSGALPGCALAVNLGIRQIANLKRENEQCVVEEDVHAILQQSKRILICEANVQSGRTLRILADYLNKTYPQVELYAAVVAWSFGADRNIQGMKGSFVGVDTDELKKATKDQIQKFGLRPGVCLFPWESPELELAEMNK